MTTNRLPLTVETMNSVIVSAFSDPGKHAELRHDWRAYIASELTLNEQQSNFFKSLPERSVKTVQRCVNSIIRHGGKLYFTRDTEGDGIFLMASDIVALKSNPLCTVCTCDANFHNCKWFPR